MLRVVKRARNQNKLSQEPDAQFHSISVAELHKVSIHASTDHLVSLAVSYFQCASFYGKGDK